jgi:hypothetical protein
MGVAYIYQDVLITLIVAQPTTTYKSTVIFSNMYYELGAPIHDVEAWISSTALSSLQITIYAEPGYKITNI